MTCLTHGPAELYMTIETVPNQVASCVLCGKQTSTRVSSIWVCIDHEELDRIKLIQIEHKLDRGQ